VSLSAAPVRILQDGRTAQLTFPSDDWTISDRLFDVVPFHWPFERFEFEATWMDVPLPLKFCHSFFGLPFPLSPFFSNGHSDEFWFVRDPRLAFL